MVRRRCCLRGYGHKTADGTVRREIRVKWWRDLQGLTCREAIFPDTAEVPEMPLIDAPVCRDLTTEAPITFFGHYAIDDGKPTAVLPNLACLDYGTRCMRSVD